MSKHWNTLLAFSAFLPYLLVAVGCGPRFYNRYQTGDGTWHRDRVPRYKMLATLPDGHQRKIRPIRNDRELYDIYYRRSGAPLRYKTYQGRMLIDTLDNGGKKILYYRYPDSSIIGSGPNDLVYSPLFTRGIISPIFFEKTSGRRTELFIGDFRRLKLPGTDLHTLRLKVQVDGLYYIGCYHDYYYLEIRNDQRVNSDPKFVEEAIVTFFL